jgi:hypothetical protein
LGKLINSRPVRAEDGKISTKYWFSLLIYWKGKLALLEWLLQKPLVLSLPNSCHIHVWYPCFKTQLCKSLNSSWKIGRKVLEAGAEVSWWLWSCWLCSANKSHKFSQDIIIFSLSLASNKLVTPGYLRIPAFPILKCEL